MSCEIRRVRRGDEGTLARVQSESWKAAFCEILSEADLQKYTDIGLVTGIYKKLLESGKGHGYILEAEGKACQIAYWDGARDHAFSNAAEIICIHSLPDARRKGYGSKLMERMLADIAADGYPEVILWVFEENTDARAFYEAKGFEVTEKTQPAFGTYEICYKKRLKEY